MHKSLVFFLAMFTCFQAMAKNDPENVAHEFLAGSINEDYESIMRNFSMDDIRLLKSDFYVALKKAKQADRESAFLHIVFGNRVAVNDITNLSDAEFIRILLKNEYSKHKLLRFDVVGSVCESTSKCFVVTKIAREGLNQGSVYPSLLSISKKDSDSTWYVETNVLMSTRAIYSVANK